MLKLSCQGQGQGIIIYTGEPLTIGYSYRRPVMVNLGSVGKSTIAIKQCRISAHCRPS